MSEAIPAAYRVVYPEVVGADEFEKAVSAFRGQLPAGVAVEFDHRATAFAPLDVLVLKIYLYNELVRLGNRVTLHWSSDQPTFGYADRMGFFSLLDDRVVVAPERPSVDSSLYEAHHHSNPMLVELTPIVPGDRDAATAALELLRVRLDENLVGVRDAGAIVDNIWTFAAESIGNIDEHSQTPVPGVIGVQRYVSRTRGTRVHLVISDGGLGIPATIRAGNPVAAGDRTDVEIVLAAFKDGLSRRLARGRGCGLTTCARIAMLHQANLRVRVGSTWARLITRSARTGVALGFFEDNATPISGTHISMDFYLDRLGQ